MSLRTGVRLGVNGRGCVGVYGADCGNESAGGVDKSVCKIGKGVELWAEAGACQVCMGRVFNWYVSQYADCKGMIVKLHACNASCSLLCTGEYFIGMG